jgi:hypothetical protein
MLNGNNRAKICFFCVKQEGGVVIYLERTTMCMEQKDLNNKLFYEVLIVILMIFLLVLIFNII